MMFVASRVPMDTQPVFLTVSGLDVSGQKSSRGGPWSNEIRERVSAVNHHQEGEENEEVKDKLCPCFEGPFLKEHQQRSDALMF